MFKKIKDAFKLQKEINEAAEFMSKRKSECAQASLKIDVLHMKIESREKFIERGVDGDNVTAEDIAEYKEDIPRFLAEIEELEKVILGQ